MKIKSVAVVCSLFIVSFANGQTESCFPLDTKSEFRWADTVFVGNITKLSLIGKPWRDTDNVFGLAAGQMWQDIKITFATSKVYKGSHENPIVIYDRYVTSAKYSLPKGDEQYLMFVSKYTARDWFQTANIGTPDFPKADERVFFMSSCVSYIPLLSDLGRRMINDLDDIK